MPWQNGPSGLGSGLNFLASFIAGRNAQQQQNIDNQQKQKAQALQEQEMRARTSATLAQQRLDEARLNIDQRAGGIDPTTGQPFQYSQMNEANSPKSSPSHRAAVLMAMANQAIQRGDKSAAAAFNAQAKDLIAQNSQAQKDALEYAKFAEKAIQDAAQRNRWSAESAQGNASLQLRLATLQERARKDAADIANQQMTRQQAQEHLQIEMANLGLAGARAQMEQGRYKMEQGRFNMQKQSHDAALAKMPMQNADAVINTLKKVGVNPPDVSANPQFMAALEDFIKNPQNRQDYLSDDPGNKTPPDIKAYLKQVQTFFPAKIDPMHNLRKFMVKP